MSLRPCSGVSLRVLSGVRGVARAHGLVRNRRDPSAQPVSGKDQGYKPMVKAFGGQRESDGVVVPLIGVQHNTPGGKGPDFDHAREVGKREGMTGLPGPIPPASHRLAVADDEPLVPSAVKVRELQRALWAAAKQSSGRRFHALFDRVCRGDVLWEAWERVRRTGVRPGWIGSPWSRWRITAWTACCVSCAVTSYRVGIVRRRPARGDPETTRR